jgi:ArsR family transcriptional regulator
MVRGLSGNKCSVLATGSMVDNSIICFVEMSRNTYRFIHIYEYVMSINDKRIFQLHAEICKTFSSPIRLEIISKLRDRKKSVNEIAALTGVRQATVSQHLAVLRQRGVVSTKREGINVYYEVANPKITQACDLMREVLFENIAVMNEISLKEVKTHI